MTDVELGSFGYKDGQESIEHQIEIHVSDLLLLPELSPLSIGDILAGLRYVMEYRIKGRKMPHLRLEICKKLSEALLMLVAQRRGGFLNRKLTEEANIAFVLFGNFLEEVDEFVMAVGSLSEMDLKSKLKLHLRLTENAPQEQQEAALAVLAILTHSTHFKGWKELVKYDEWDSVESYLTKNPWQNMKMPLRKTKIWPPQALYFDRKPARVVEIFHTNLEKGLETASISEIRSFYGSNDLPKAEKPSLLKMFWKQISDFMILILLAATIVSAVIDHEKPTSAIVLGLVIVFNVGIGMSQEWKASKALEALMVLSVPTAKVLRDGHVLQIESRELVPGDVVILEEGDAVPADLRLVETSQLEIVESVLTGESIPTEKNTKTIRVKSRKLAISECAGNAFMATTVAKGRGKGIVVRIGKNTEMGKISSAISSLPEIKTPIQMKLSKLGKILVILAVFLCVLVTIIGIAWGKDAMDMVRVGVSLAVSVIPEGLVAVVTVTMALAVSRMAKKNAIVRNLPSVETLGSVTVICSDKTGTLTEGKMTTRQLKLSDGEFYQFLGSLSDPNNGDIIGNIENPLFKACMLVSALCNNSSVTKIDGSFKYVGDATELALLVAANHSKLSKEIWEINFEKVYEVAFDSNRKLMTVVYKYRKEVEGLNCIVLTKGAPENLLGKCKFFSSKEKSEKKINFVNNEIFVEEITEKFLEYLSKENEKMALEGLRVLGLGMKSMNVDFDSEDWKNSLETDLCFVGLAGLIDPPRPTVKNSILECQKAGIKVCMITGDHIQTATAISTSLGIFNPEDPEKNRAIRGKDLDLLSDEAIAELKPFPSVFARVSPENKLTIVRVLQSLGHSVSMTGDGVNDAPAIKRANIGVAMGIAGTEITKQAASIVLSDDNFSTIVAAVKEGRRVFDNISKFIIYLLSCNSAEIWIVLISVTANMPSPFSAINILYANIIADIPPSMSIGLEPAEEDIMERPPRSLKKGIIDLKTGLVILVQGLLLALLGMALYVWEYLLRTEEERQKELVDMRSIVFVGLTTNQLVLSFLSRSMHTSVFRTGITSNQYMIGAFLLSFGFLVAGCYIPGFNGVLELRPFGWIGWVKILGSIVILIAANEFIKWILRMLERREIRQQRTQSR